MLLLSSPAQSTQQHGKGEMVLLKTFKTAPNLHNCHHSQNIIQTLNLQTTFCNSPFLFYTILDLIFSTGKCSGVLFCKFTTWDFVYGGEILIANTHNGKHKHMERSAADYKLQIPSEWDLDSREQADTFAGRRSQISLADDGTRWTRDGC